MTFRPYCDIPDCYSETYVHFRDHSMCKHHALVEMLKYMTSAQIDVVLTDSGYVPCEKPDVIEKLPDTERATPVLIYRVDCRYCGCKYNQRYCHDNVTWPPLQCGKCGQFNIKTTPQCDRVD